MEYVILFDTSIVTVNRGRQENEQSNIVYRDKYGTLHFIDFDICADNYKAEHKNLSGNYIGERKIDKHCFILYTSGIKTKIVFKRMYVSNIFRYHLLSGSKSNRFLKLHNLIYNTNYTTHNL